MYPGAGVVPPHSQPPCCAVSNAELPSAPLPSLLLPPSLLPPPPLLLATLPVPAALTASDRLPTQHRLPVKRTDHLIAMLS